MSISSVDGLFELKSHGHRLTTIVVLLVVLIVLVVVLIVGILLLVWVTFR